MSFGTHARRARDRDLPYRERYGALRCAVNRYCPIGFHATWSFLTTVGNVKKDEEALARALDVLETSRDAWFAELDAFTARRRSEKQQHRRTPTASDRLRFQGYRWPGPDGHAAMFRTVEQLWEAHRSEPFPEMPAGAEGDLVSLEATIAGCISSYLNRGGEAGPGRSDVLLTCLAASRKELENLEFPRTGYHLAFRYFRRLHKIAELVLNDTSEPVT